MSGSLFKELVSENIVQAISRLSKGDEDIQQELWVSALENSSLSDDEILAVLAKHVRALGNVSANEYFKEISTETVISHSGDDSDLTLGSVLPAKEESPIVPYENKARRINGKKATKHQSVIIDLEVSARLRQMFPGIPYKHAIRLLLSLPIPVKHTAWQPEEDELLRELYSKGGSYAARLEIDRTRDAIIERARILGIKSERKAPHIAGLLTGKELAAHLNVSYSTVMYWRKKNLIHGVKKSGYVFFNPNSTLVKKALKSHLGLAQITSRSVIPEGPMKLS